MAKEKWIQKINLKKGALTKTASKHGAIKKGNGIKKAWLKKAAKGEGVSKTTAKRARLALSFSKFKKGKSGKGKKK